MRKLKRPAVIKSFLEARIAKNQRRIQKISDETYKLRQQLEFLESLPKQTPTTKADLAARDKSKEAAVEAVTDSADQEIGNPTPEETSNAIHSA